MTNTYPEPYKSAKLDSLVDPALFYNRECTSYCAWKIKEYTGRWLTQTVPGDAKLWGIVLTANGYKKVDKPTGSGKFVGVLPKAGPYGHVYWWEGGNSVSQYNYGTPGAYSTMSVNLNDATWYQITKSTNPPVNQGGDDVITNKDTNILRAGMRDIKGWNAKNVDAGKNDAGELKAWVGKTWVQYFTEAIKEGAVYRKKRDAALAYYAKKAANDKQLATLTAQNKSLSDVNKQLSAQADIDAEEIANLEKQLSAKPTVVDEKAVVENWLVKLWNSLFKKG